MDTFIFLIAPILCPPYSNYCNCFQIICIYIIFLSYFCLFHNIFCMFCMILYKLNGLNIVFFYKSTILTILLISAFIDIKTQIIPDRFYISILLISFIFSFAEKNLENWYLGVAAFCLPLLLIYSLSDIFKKELIGFGDIKLMCSVGGFITYTGITSIIYFYELLYITAGFFCVLLILLKKPKKRVYIAFAPFIFTAVLLWEFRNVL